MSTNSRGFSDSLKPWDIKTDGMRQLRMISRQLPPRPFDLDVDRVVIGLRTRGCALFIKNKGCIHCGLVADPMWRHDLSEEEMFENFRQTLESTDLKPESTLCVYVAGSFFDDQELPPGVRHSVLELVSKDDRVRRISVESRPGYVTPERVSGAAKAASGKLIEVGIGLDSIDDRIRNEVVGKGTTVAQYHRAVENLRAGDMRVLMYALVKPPTLSEREAIEESCATVYAGFGMGADAVSLEPLAVQAGTPLTKIYEHGEFRPPWLWTIVEVVRRCHHLGELRVGGDVVFPPPIASAQNCPKCSQAVRDALRGFDRTQDFESLDQLYCDCQEEWRQALSH